MESAYVKNLGEIVEAKNKPYDECRKMVESVGADVSKMTARNTAYARIQLGKDHEFSKSGNWIIEEVIYNLKGFNNPVLLSVPGPVYHNPKIATKCHINDKPFKLSDKRLVMPESLKQYGKTWNDAITDMVREDYSNSLEALAIELPAHETFEIPIKELLKVNPNKLSSPAYSKTLSKEVQTAVVLWKDQTQAYAEKVLNPAGIENVPFLLIGKDRAKSRKYTFSNALWLRGVEGRSSLVGYYYNRCLSSVRGIREKRQRHAKIYISTI